ncbi:hypothetical protein ACH5Y9_15865 [Methylomonas sp. BW4-1]|uniref:hypothetical protein n=1 Tax=Methylomonas sp. BW4-1 TaxID=3376685 RepID=UPI00404135D3
MNLVLKQLSRFNGTAANVLPILVNLTPLTLHLSNGLTNAARSETDIATNTKALKIAKLAIQLLRHLSLAFCRTVETKQLDTSLTQQAIFYALQLVGYCLRSTALFYEMPSTTLWKKSGLLYTIAGELQLLKKPVSSKPQEFKLQSTIEAVIKRNLLFALSKPNQYSTTEISQLFQLVSRHQDRLEISKTPNPDCRFIWNLGSEPSPMPRTNSTLPRGLGVHQLPELRPCLATWRNRDRTEFKHANQTGLAFDGIQQYFRIGGHRPADAGTLTRGLRCG